MIRGYCKLWCRLLVCVVLSFVNCGHADEALTVGVAETMNGYVSESQTGIPFKTKNEVTGEFVTKLIVALVVLLVIAWIVLYVTKNMLNTRIAGRISEKYINVLEVRRISPKATLYLIHFEDRRILMAQSGDSMIVLDKLIESNNESHAAVEPGI